MNQAYSSLRSITGNAYNERLFSGWGPRAAYHLSRYRWLAREIQKLNLPHPRIIELGCFDGKTLDFIEKPSYYLGLDADGEGGLRFGQQRWQGIDNVELVMCRHADEIPNRGVFDLGVCMETFEHLSDDLADAYLCKLRSLITGKIFITVPRERGFVFLAKHLAKRAANMPSTKCYSAKDVWMLATHHTNQVQPDPRDGHKGFDDRRLLAMISKYFHVERVTGIFPTPIRSLSLTTGIVASAR